VGDAIVLFLAMVLACLGTIAVIALVKRNQKIARQRRLQRERWMRDALHYDSDYLRRLRQAASEDEVDRLAAERNEREKRWDGLFSRSSPGLSR
jgi:hypothetical protein